MDEFLEQLSSSSGVGVSISAINCGSPTYADDTSLIAASPSALQFMLDLVDQYGHKWRYQLNGIKSVVLVFGEAAKTRERRCALRVWKLGESSLNEVDEQLSSWHPEDHFQFHR